MSKHSGLRAFILIFILIFIVVQVFGELKKLNIISYDISAEWNA